MLTPYRFWIRRSGKWVWSSRPFYPELREQGRPHGPMGSRNFPLGALKCNFRALSAGSPSPLFLGFPGEGSGLALYPRGKART